MKRKFIRYLFLLLYLCIRFHIFLMFYFLLIFFRLFFLTFFFFILDLIYFLCISQKKVFFFLLRLSLKWFLSVHSSFFLTVFFFLSIIFGRTQAYSHTSNDVSKLPANISLSLSLFLFHSHIHTQSTVFIITAIYTQIFTRKKEKKFQLILWNQDS